MSSKNIEDAYSLSPMQQGMLFHSLYAVASGVYIEQISCSLHGNLNVSVFVRAWQQVVDRHPVLRTAFVWERLEQPLQVVGRYVKLPKEQQDWRGVSSVEQQEQLKILLYADRQRGFELSKAPLMRLIFIQLTDDTYHFIWSYHHLLLDGWSVSLIFKEVMGYYEALCQGQNLYLEATRPYRDYIAWQKQQDRFSAEVFWREMLQGFTTPTRLRVDRVFRQLSDQEESYDEREVKLSIAATAALKSLAQQEHLTLNTLVQGAWALLLSCYSSEEDVVFGATVSGRPSALEKVESMVGLFINTLPIRVRVAPEELLLPWLKEIQNRQAQARQYEYSSLVEIQGWSEVARDLPLFESLVVFENYPIDSSLGERIADLKVNNVNVFEKTNYPITAIVMPNAELILKILYDRHRFDSATITRMLGHFQTLLEGIIANPSGRLSAFSLLTEVERLTLLLKWNDTHADYPLDQSIHELFEAQVERTPNAVAVVFEGEHLTYRQLNQRANQLAHYSIQLGVEADVLVGICMERSLDAIVAILGILKAGGAYLPLDPAYPQERLDFMLADAKLSLVISHSSLVKKFEQITTICLNTDWGIIQQESEENPVNRSTSEPLAYVIYTSGSTGQPKGVLGLHRGAVNRFHWMWQNYPFTPEEVCCQKTSLNFVDSVWEIFGPLLQGVQTVIICDRILKDPEKFVETLAKNNMTRLVLVPSLLRVLLDTFGDLQKRLPKLKFWVTSGEALSADLLQKFRQILPDSTLLNLYGSSEVSADVTCYRISPQDRDNSQVSIGRPIANTQIYVLDRDLQPVPIGVPGELYVSGAGLARGYLNHPELTDEKFIPNPFLNSDNFTSLNSELTEDSLIQNSKIYRTGDLVRYWQDGNLEFIGRSDNQIKLRGFRIELGEIEAALAQHSGVEQAVVLVRENEPDNKQLVAYIISDPEKAIAVSELHHMVKEKLPSYMVPSAFIMLESLPLLPNGKVDLQALPAPEQARPKLEAAYQGPRTEIEQTIANIWQEVLHLESICIDDNFFDLGGDSLLLVRVYSKLKQIFQREFSLVEMFQYPTVGYLAEYLIQEENKQRSSPDSSQSSVMPADSIKRRRRARQEYREQRNKEESSLK